MPGKHAPESPASFYASVTRAGAFALGVLGLVIVIVLVAVNSGEEPQQAAGTTTPTPTLTRSSTAPTPTTTTTTEQTPEPDPMVKRSALDDEVLNGTLTTGLAASVAEKMEDEGYRDIAVGNAPPADRTTIYYRPKFKREAERLLADLPELKRVRPMTSTTPGDSAIVVVLGADYEG